MESGITKRLPLNQIRPSQRNPRGVTQEMVDARAAGMKEAGQINPILIRPLTPAELSLEPDKNIVYEIIDGEVRYRAAKKNGDRDIEAKILNVGPKEAFIIAVTANRSNKPDWIEDYKAIKTMLQDDRLIQRQVIAAALETDPGRISRALRVIEVLNDDSWELLLANCKKSKGSWQISESTLIRLADLEHPNDAHAGLRMVLNKQMTESQTKAYVEHVLAGKPIEVFEPVKTSIAPRKPKAGNQPVEPASKLKPQGELVIRYMDSKWIPVSRVRIHKGVFNAYHPVLIERKALQMRSIPLVCVNRITVRTLSEMEKAADPGHDYELYGDVLTFRAAQLMGWETLDAYINDSIDSQEALRLSAYNNSRPQCLPWVEIYEALKERLEKAPGARVENLAVELWEDPEQAKKLLKSLKLINQEAWDAIWNSNYFYSEEEKDEDSYLFTRELALLLARLENADPDPERVRKLVQKTVEIAIDNEIRLDDMEELVNFALAGNDPEEFFVEEA